MTNTSLNQAVYRLLELARIKIKDTDSVSKRIVVDWLQSNRAKLLKQKFNKAFIDIDDHLVQRLGSTGVSLEKVSSSLVTGVTTGDYMLRTTIDIPRTIERKGGVGTFTRIGPADQLSTRFKVISYQQALSAGNGHFNYHTPYAFVLGDRVYINSKSGSHLSLNYLDIRGVFQDAVAAALISDATWDYDDDYPINKSIMDDLEGMVIEGKFKLLFAAPGDKTDDGQENLEGNVAVQKR